MVPLKFEEALQRLASSRDAEALGWMRAERAHILPSLYDALAHSKKRMRAAARMVLVELGIPREIDAIEEMLRSSRPEVRTVGAEWAVALVPPPAGHASVLFELFVAEREDDVRMRLLQAWTRIVGSDDLRLLLACLRPSLPAAHRTSLVEAILLLLEDEPPRDVERALGDVSLETVDWMVDLFEEEPPTRGRELVMKTLQGRRASRADEAALAGFGRIIASPTRQPEPSPLMYAERVVEAIEQRLSEKGPRSLIVVGPSGAGKTAALHEVFRRRAISRGTTVLYTTTSLVMAGTKYLGEWQTRLRDLMLASSAPRDVIVCFGDVNMLTMTGRSDTSTDNFASFLKPYIESGEITIVGESTPEELAVGLNRAPDLKRLFREVMVAEPTRAQTLEIVSRHAAAEAGDEAVALPVLDQILDLADMYVPDGAFPGKAVDLLRQTLVRVRRARGGIDALSVSDLVETLAERTGLPQWLMDDRSAMRVEDVRAFFGERILGQEEAVEAVVDLITLIKAGLTDPKKPFAVLFFVGPTGVGKTEIAKALAEFLFGDAERLVRLDMSEFKTYEGYQRLIGTPSWNSLNEEGMLTRRVRAQPFSVVLLDEFEKAHPNVYDLMLQVFDDGRLTSGRGELVSFRQTIVIMTSNLASGRGAASLGFVERDVNPQRRDVLRALEEYFRPEFLNRVDRVVVFEPLDIDVMRRVARREIDKVLRRSGIQRRGLLVEVDDSVITRLLQEGFSPVYGARPLKRVLEREVLLPLARRLVGGLAAGSLVRVFAVDGRIRIRVLPPPDDVLETTREVEAAPADVLRRVEARLRACREAALSRGLQREKEALLEETHADDFWRSPARARQVTERVRVLDHLLAALVEAEGDFEGLAERQGPRQPKRARELADRVERLAVHFGFSGPRDTADAWIAMRRLDTEDVEVDPLARLVEMYTGWAQRNACEATVLDARPSKHGLSQVLVHVVGPHAFGQLQGEAGLHRFARRRQGGGRRSAFVRVDVIAGADELLPAAEVGLEVRAVEADTKACRKGASRPRSWARAVHRQSLLVAEGVSALSVEENRDAMLEYLAALVAHGQDEETNDAVRVYYLPENEVRDLVTGLRVHDGADVLAGGLMPFIAARVERL